MTPNEKLRESLSEIKNSTITIKELEIDGETALKILACLKSHEPEIWENLRSALKKALPKETELDKLKELFDGLNPNK